VSYIPALPEFPVPTVHYATPSKAIPPATDLHRADITFAGNYRSTN
jgi:hypothetical protein